MREILFRGKRIDNDEWIEGYLTICDERSFIIENGKIGCLCFFTLPKGHYVFEPYIEVNPSTVGQFTGVCDLVGKRIFEGDIVDAYGASGKYDERGVVNWNNLFSQWEVGKTTMYGKKTCSTYEIVGNIHDKPELRGVVNGSTD